MYYMPVLRVRRVGNSLGVLLPKSLIREKGLKVNDEVVVDVNLAPDIESVRGAIKHLGLTVDELNELTNEGEEL